MSSTPTANALQQIKQDRSELQEDKKIEVQTFCGIESEFWQSKFILEMPVKSRN
jgi:hypothetical protein